MGTKWRGSQSSPDWTDIFTVMRAIEGLHSVTIFVTMTAGVFDGPSGFITIFAQHTSKMGEASVLGEPVMCSCGEWPCKEHSDFAACLYSGLLELDSMLSSKLWVQSKLPFTAS